MPCMVASSCSQEHHKGRDVDIDARVPKGPEGSPLLAAVDAIRRGGKPMMAEDAQEHLDYVVVGSRGGRGRPQKGVAGGAAAVGQWSSTQ